MRRLIAVLAMAVASLSVTFTDTAPAHASEPARGVCARLVTLPGYWYPYQGADVWQASGSRLYREVQAEDLSRGQEQGACAVLVREWRRHR